MPEYRFMVRRSSDGEEPFFAKMGRFFASTAIRKEMGGSPLSDLPNSHWLTFDLDGRVVAFLLADITDKHMRIKDGYVEPDHRGNKLLSKLVAHAADIAKSNGYSIYARVRKSIAKHFKPSKFKVATDSGDWVNLEKIHAAGRKKTQP
jgi:GNAT superfamily N-acetyltransferase